MPFYSHYIFNQAEKNWLNFRSLSRKFLNALVYCATLACIGSEFQALTTLCEKKNLRLLSLEYWTICLRSEFLVTSESKN